MPSRVRPLFAGALLACAIAGCGTEPRPGARGTLEVDRAALGEARSEAAVDAIVATEVERASSEPITRRVVDVLRLHETASFIAGAPVAEEDAVRALRERITASRRRDTLLIDVHVADEDPSFARTLCDQALEAMLLAAAERELAPREAHREYLRHQHDQAREQLERAAEDSADRPALESNLGRTEAALRRAEEAAMQPLRPSLRVLERCSAHALDPDA
jgi:uncharacterized protein involved in exopolysaccharide biosynthesis